MRASTVSSESGKDFNKSSSLRRRPWRRGNFIFYSGRWETSAGRFVSKRNLHLNGQNTSMWPPSPFNVGHCLDFRSKLRSSIWLEDESSLFVQTHLFQKTHIDFLSLTILTNSTTYIKRILFTKIPRVKLYFTHETLLGFLDPINVDIGLFDCCLITKW